MLRDRLNEADGYIPPGQQVTFADVSHEFTGCGRISQWSMVFKCAAASREDGYPLELQVFQAQGTRQSILIVKNQVTLTNEQCERQLASFNVSLPFCDGDYAGIYMPDAAGISGLGYRDTENLENAFYVRAISAPLAVRQKIALSSSDLQQGALPLVSVEGKYTLIHLLVCMYVYIILGIGHKFGHQVLVHFLQSPLSSSCVANLYNIQYSCGCMSSVHVTVAT